MGVWGGDVPAGADAHAPGGRSHYLINISQRKFCSSAAPATSSIAIPNIADDDGLNGGLRGGCNRLRELEINSLVIAVPTISLLGGALLGRVDG